MEQPTSTKPIARPVKSQERIDFVDILRGFALLGVFLFNMYGFGGDAFNMTDWAGWLNRTLVLLRDFLIQAKFYSLFSFLFGWGMSIHLLRAQERDGNFLPIYLRRLTLLLLIGLAHGIFIWDGDILTVYALLGFILILFRKRPERFLLTTAGLLLAFSIFMTLPYDWVDSIRTWYRERTAVFHWANPGQVSYVTGTYTEILHHRAQSFIGRNADGLIYFLGNVLSMFLIGLYVGKRQIFQQVEAHLPLLRWVMRFGLIIGVVFNGLFVLNIYWSQLGRPAWYPADYAWTIHTGTRTIGAPALMLFYVTMLTLLLRQEKWQERFAPLGSVGRMALSNYLTQSIIGTLIFNGYGLGLYGRTGPIFYLILASLIFLAQIRFSVWWLARYQFGPAEWAWRSLTYGRRQPLRRGEKLEDVRPFSWKQWVGVGLLVGLLVGWYGWRNWRPDDTVAGSLTLVASAEVAATPTPIVPMMTPAPTVAPTPRPAIVPPVVQPIVYNPGSIVANGDWGALADSFAVEMALATIEELSGQPYNGRAAGTPGGAAAGNYIADQFAQLGLQPAGEDGYFQPFPIHQTQLDGLPRLIVETAAGEIKDDYILHQDFAPAVRVYMGVGATEGDLVWANNCARDDFDGLDAVAKVVMCRGNWPHAELGRTVLEHGAAALLLLAGPESYPLDFTPVYYDTWVPDALSIPTFRISPVVAADLVADSGHTVPDLTINFTSFPLDSHVRLEINTEACPDCTARNVLGVLPGRDPDQADEALIISAHYDHLGQSPDGTTWAGANDNASGVAAMLEIARSWQAAGYVPPRTVLFAAWDAEEIGLLGSRHYVENPRYPLDQTVGVINLDMVGAGEETLYLSGAGLKSQTLAVAATMGITATVQESGRSDHFPFQQAGIPAGTLIWFGDGDVPSYHRPIDTPDVIEPDKLAAVGRIAMLTALNLADAEPQLNRLLARRAAAIADNDADAFLATSHPGHRSTDRVWLADVAALAPISATMTADHVRLLGDTAVALTHLKVTYLENKEGQPITRTLSVSLPAKFQSSVDGWQWAGADLITTERGEGDIFTVSYPTDVNAATIAEAARFVTEQYSTTAALLSLSTNQDARLILYPDAETLRADTALNLPDGTNSWVGPGVIKLIYSETITNHQQLAASLSQLLLTEAGVTETAVTWLWHGLADLVAAESNLETVQRSHLPVLTAAFAEEADVNSAATKWAAAADWAAVDYLQRQVGWDGLGQFIIAAGQNGLEAALGTTLNMNATQFAAAWQEDWQNRLAEAERAVNRVLTNRMEAVFAADRTAYLGTLEESNPFLVAEESEWFDDLRNAPPRTFSLTGKPLALYEDGRILANITQVADPGGTSQDDILFAPGDDGLRWAGPRSETLIGDKVTVLYPPGQLKAAQHFLTSADDLIPKLPDYLRTDLPDHLTIRLPEDPATRLPELLVRRQLVQLGVTDEWLLEGTAVYLAAQLDKAIEQDVAGYLHNLWLGVTNNRIGSVSEIPTILQTGNESTRKLAITQAWDMVRYLVQSHGDDALQALLRAQGEGQSIDAALQTAIGQSLAEFEAAWVESLGRAHARPEWIDVANSFDGALATQHIESLTAPDLAGRQAGSSGAEMAAAYIAEQFATYGLEPVPIGLALITSTEILTETAVLPPELSYFQTFTIEYAALTAVPRLEIDSEVFEYRRDFMTLIEEIPGGGFAEGELVFVQDGAYTGMDLSGKIVVRQPGPETAVLDDMTAAMEHGAAGLILIGESDYEKDFQMKRPLPANFPDEPMIPTLLLTQIGLERLLAMTGMTRADLNNMPLALPLGLHVTMDVPLSQPEVVETANVLGLLPGSDPDLRDEVVILSAHYDHVGDDPGGRIYSGANDNASGVAALLEMARLWQETGYRPSRSILFAAWGAQEPGEIGSSYFISHPVVPLTDTVSVVVLDAVGGGVGHRLMAQGNWERDGLMLFGMEQADGVLDGRLRTNIPADQSDDIPFRTAGLPTMLLTWTDASEDNWPDDLADEIDLGDLGVSGRMAALAIMTIAR